MENSYLGDAQNQNDWMNSSAILDKKGQNFPGNCRSNSAK